MEWNESSDNHIVRSSEMMEPIRSFIITRRYTHFSLTFSIVFLHYSTLQSVLKCETKTLGTRNDLAYCLTMDIVSTQGSYMKVGSFLISRPRLILSASKGAFSTPNEHNRAAPS